MAEPVISSKRRFPLKWVLIGGGVVVALGIGLFVYKAGGFNSLLSGKNTTESDVEASQAAYAKTKASKTLSEASERFQSGDTSGAEALYEDAANSASTNEEKSEYYIDFVTVLWSSDNPAYRNADKALEYALRAEQANPSAISASWLGLIYRDLGDTQKADSYDALADERSGYNGQGD